ncbi:Hypothetical predicted protein [Pelobates cultripes]|uniref:Uncharacterized protein n=1 Tax=Pelobates cultripes TaxID=61616 RepID=A0AAD1RHK7_PELCU|nr:Hypothetical predicted protein [Pelobates cultripes]
MAAPPDSPSSSSKDEVLYAPDEIYCTKGTIATQLAKDLSAPATKILGPSLMLTTTTMQEAVKNNLCRSTLARRKSLQRVTLTLRSAGVMV